MSKTIKLELIDGVYGEIDAKIHDIEKLAYDGVFTGNNKTPLLQQIIPETKKLRQILREVLLLAPGGDSSNGSGDAA
jgi:hypothetical protein